MGQKLYMDSEDLKSTDTVEKAICHGTLSMGFIGLAECLVALTGKHHGQSQEAQSLGLAIVSYIRRRCDEATKKYKLNFTLLATPAEGLFYVAGYTRRRTKREIYAIRYCQVWCDSRNHR